MDKLLKNELEQKIKERDELLENGADREDIINANKHKNTRDTKSNSRRRDKRTREAE